MKMRKLLRDLISARTTNTDVRLTYVRGNTLQRGATVGLKALDAVLPRLDGLTAPLPDALREEPSRGNVAKGGFC